MSTFDRDHANRFLAEMYDGTDGLIQVCRTGNFVGDFFPTTDDGITAAADYAAKLDQHEPKGVYFRATTLNGHPGLDEHGKPRRGGAADTLDVPAFWADLDFGVAGHKGVNLPPDADAAHALIAEAGLPEPTILIHSGGGLYPLWKTSVMPTPEQAAVISVAIQAALEKASLVHGWPYGTGVSDLARVLRLPGSVNRKTDTPRACQLIGGTGNFVELESLPTEVPQPPAKPAASIPAPRRTPSAYTTGDRGVFDALADTASWADILEPSGWTYVGSDSAGELWMRPGGSDSEYSARCFEHNMVCHSESAGLPSGANQRLTKGRVFAWIYHSGDLSCAARALIRGDHNLPAAVQDAIKQALPDVPAPRSAADNSTPPRHRRRSHLVPEHLHHLPRPPKPR